MSAGVGVSVGGEAGVSLAVAVAAGVALGVNVGLGVGEGLAVLSVAGLIDTPPIAQWSLLPSEALRVI